MVSEAAHHFHVKMFELGHKQLVEWWGEGNIGWWILNDEWGREIIE